MLPESSTVAIWPIYENDLVIKSSKDALNGIAYDKVSNKEIKTDLIIENKQIMLQGYTPGKYLIAIVLNDKVDKGKNAFSYTEIILSDKSKILINKLFSEDIQDYSFDAKNILIKNYEN